jgi:signal transduction histidine kinase/CheY-like chemotaxis protein
LRTSARAVPIGIGLALLLVFLSGLLAQQALQRQVEDGRAVAHTHRLLERVEGVLATVKGAESAQRGYVISDSALHLEQFRAAEHRARFDLDVLAALVSSAPDRQRVHRLDSLVVLRLVVLARTLELHEAEGFTVSRQSIRTGEGTELMDSVRSAAFDLAERQHQLLRVRSRESERSTRAAARMVLATTGLGVLLLAAASGLLLRDHRRRLAAEAGLRGALDRARAADRAKSQFLATVSHEIRTPLNAIIGMTDLLRDTSLSADQSDFARSVQVNGEALLTLVGDLLDSSKIDSGQMLVDHVPFDLLDVVEGVAETLALRAESKGLDLVLSIEPRVPPRVVGDPHRLRQVLMNLVGNAIKFTDRGDVRMILGHEPVGRGCVALVFQIRDSGVGIQPADQDRIFQRFVQAGDAPRQRGGTGLGLSISSALARAMGGRLSLESSVPGRGSCFVLELELMIDDGPGAGARPDLAGLRILTAVRHPLRREAVALLIRDAGADPVSPVDYAAACEAMARSPEVAIVDDDFDRSHQLVERLRVQIGAHRIVRLCSMDSGVFDSAPADSGTACVFKPMRQRRLLEAVSAAAHPTRVSQVQPADPDPVTSHARVRVLVADDNRDNRRLLSSYLSAAGYSVDIATDGWEAVECAERMRYDLILMDVEMPILDGISATWEIRAEERRRGVRSTPIVAVTAHAFEDVRQRCLASGMDGFMTKPVDRNALDELVRRWGERRSVVLVADDAPEMHTLVRHYLAREPYRLVHADNGEDALAVFARETVSVVLLDMDMPGMDGYETARAIRSRPDGTAVPILAMTGYSAAESREACEEAGCSGFLQKPVRRGELRAAVRAALDTGTRRDERPSTASGTRSHPPSRPLSRERRLSRRIERLVLQEDMDSALPIAREIAGFSARAGRHLIRVLADELAHALARGDSAAATDWNLRLGGALREAERLTTLRSSGLLDTDSEDIFDRLTREASAVLGTPITLLSLVDEHRQFFKSSVGLSEPLATERETPLSHSFCQHVVASDDVFVVEDARDHPLVRDNLAIRDLGVIAYAGVPVRTSDGIPLGSFCAIDTRPRRWSGEDLAVLRELAERAAAEIAARRPTGSETGTAGDEALADVPPAEFVNTFLTERRNESGVLDLMLSCGQLEEVARIGHQLKGSATVFGFPEIGLAGAHMERAARAGDVNATITAREMLRKTVEAAISVQEDPE